MEPLRQDNFEDEWQRAFENTSIPPPSDMWDKIEEELERKKRRPFLFILRPSAIASGVAAALVLVLGGLFFLNRNNIENQKVVAESKSKINQSTEPAIAQKNPNIGESIAKIPNSKPNIPNDATLASVEKPTQLADNFSLKSKGNKLRPNIVEKQNSSSVFEKPALAAMAEVEEKGNNSASESKSITTQNIDNQLVISKKNALLTSDYRNIFLNLSPLKSKEYVSFGSSRTLNRNKLVFDSEIPETQAIVSNESKFWVGIQSGVSPFDPNMKLGGLNTYALQAADAFAKASNNLSTPSMGGVAGQPSASGPVAVSQPQNAIKAGVGTNTGFAFGYKIAKKWNVESGIRYLRGNSTLQSNTYAFQQNGYVNTFLADYLLQNSSNSIPSNAQNPINTVVADASQFNNRYEYLMIPMQLGYEIGLSNKLGLNILAGISTDIFLQNTIANDNTFVQEKSIINSTNNIYKPLNISGLGGIRASYLLSKHWQANIGSSYQHSLFSGINSSTALQMRLRMFGVNYGLNYRF